MNCSFPFLKYQSDYLFDRLDGYEVVYGPLTAILSRLPNLHTVSIGNPAGVVQWEAINAVVQIPQLRNLRIHGFLDDRRNLPRETEQSLRLPVSSLASIDYPSSGYRKISATETKLFSVLFLTPESS